MTSFNNLPTGISTAVAKYLWTLLAITNMLIGQLAKAWGRKGTQPSDSTNCLPSSSPFHLPFPSYCDRAQAWRYIASRVYCMTLGNKFNLLWSI
jgi:hypothetical protein